MASRQQHDGNSEVILTQGAIHSKDIRENRQNSDSEDSEEDDVGIGKLPDFVDLNEMGQSEQLRFHRLSDFPAAESRHNGICPFCAESIQ